MNTVLLLGVGPLPIDDTDRVHAPGQRVWHLANLIADAGHRVMIAVIGFGDFSDGPEGAFATSPVSVAERIAVFRMKYHSTESARRLASLHATSRFACVVSTTDIMNSVAADFAPRVPLWLDYFGDPFCERQVQGSAYGNDASQLELWKLMAKGLLKGDRFSATGEAQRFLLMGQLGFAGRLNQDTSGAELVHVLPNFHPYDPPRDERAVTAIRGRRAPSGAWLVLWTGGYNAWSDPETLFHGLASAMRRDGDIHFVSTGGEIQGHDNLTFRRFRKLIDDSGLENKFTFLGWVPSDDLPSVYRQADVAVSLDLDCYEAEVGSRTRLNEWIQCETPVVCTAICESARRLAAEDLIATFEPGDARGLADAILRIKADRETTRFRAAKAKQWYLENYGSADHFKPLLDWVAAPAFAPDRSAAPDGPPAGSLAALHAAWVAGGGLGATVRPAGAGDDRGGNGAKRSLLGRVAGRLFGKRG